MIAESHSKKFTSTLKNKQEFAIPSRRSLTQAIRTVLLCTIALSALFIPAFPASTALHAEAALPEFQPVDYFKKMGDAYYTRRDYETAHLHYRHLYRTQPDEATASRLLLSSLRVDDDRAQEAVLYGLTPKDPGFTFAYLSLYTAFRLQRYDLADPLIRAIDADLASAVDKGPGERGAGADHASKTKPGSGSKAELPYQAEERRRLQFLRGAQYIDLQRFDAAIIYYSELGRVNDATGQRALQLAEDLRQHGNLSKKSPWLAASLSAVLPGAGQAYTGHYSDATMAAFWNLTFVGGSAYLYSLERAGDRPHTGSIIAGVVGLIFYASNIAGAYASANRRNIFMERRFAEQLRSTHFALDRVERDSGIEFTRPLE